MSTTTNLAIQELGAGVRQPEIVINAALNTLDAAHTLKGARVYNSADISISNATPTALTFNSERYDTNTIHSTSSNTSRLTLPFAGKWRIGATIDWDNNATGYRSALIRKNGTTLLAANTHPAASGVDTNQVTSTEDVFAANDYVEIVVSQNSGGSLNVKALGNYSPEFYCSFIGY